MGLKKYRFKEGNFRHFHSEVVTIEAINDDGTVSEIKTVQTRRLTPGEVIEMDEQRVKEANLLDRFEEVTSGGSAREVPPEMSIEEVATRRAVEDWSPVLSQGVGDVRAAIQAMDDPEDLAALRVAEERGANRKMVLDAAVKRHEELKKQEERSQGQGQGQR